MKKKIYNRRPMQHKGSISLNHTYVIAAMITLCGVGCGIRHDLLPTRNTMLAELDEPTQHTYFALMQLLDGDTKTKLERSIGKICSKLALNKFIVTHFNYRKLHQDLLEILPTPVSTVLNRELKQATEHEQSIQIINARLPKSFQLLDAETQNKFIALPDRKRQAILIAGMRKEKLPVKKNISTTSKTLSTTPQILDFEQIINQTVQECDQKGLLINHGIAKDDWGTQLPLTGQRRVDFFRLIMPFSHSDQQALKSLLLQSDAVSVEHFLSVYDDTNFFNMNDRVLLLDTLIYLYKGWPKLCMQMCNDPTSLGTSSQLSIACKIGSKKKVAVLTKLRDALSS